MTDEPLSQQDTQAVNGTGMPAPVFVDASGRRRSRIQMMFYALGGVALLYGMLIGASVVGGSVGPRYLLPFAEPVGKPVPAQTTTDADQPVGRSEQRTTAPTRGTAPRIERTPQAPATRSRGTVPSGTSAAPQTTAPGPSPAPSPPPTSGTATATPAPATTAPLDEPSQPVTPATTEPSPSTGPSGTAPAAGARRELVTLRTRTRPELPAAGPARPGAEQ